MGTIVQACSLSCFKVSLWNMHSTIHWQRSDAFKSSQHITAAYHNNSLSFHIYELFMFFWGGPKNSCLMFFHNSCLMFFGVPRSSRGVVSAMSAIRFAGAKRCENCRSFPGSGALRDMAEGRGAECAKTAFRFRHFKVKNQPRQSEIDRADLFKSSNSLLKFSISPNVYQ